MTKVLCEMSDNATVLMDIYYSLVTGIVEDGFET